MPLEKNTHLGTYEILAPIGAGGMGEVYRAKDSKLGRDVALKVLPDAFARDADRMSRFQREAKVLASLNHTNIATIHGLEDSGKTHALVMELVEGPTLADRIRLGPIPIDEALRIAKQICDALEYAHERGIVHRDLKPANVKVTADDAVKVLDFGLAKAIEGDAASADIATSPTMSRMATMAGMLLGTAAYMSPEQAKAKPVDRRADIWAFGCVLYEMLTGKMAFRGETVTDTLAAVIKEEPDWKQLPAATPVRVRVLLQRCLQKDPKQRLRDIGDARISLEEVLSGAQDPISTVSSGRLAIQRWLWPAIAAVCALAAIAAWLLAPARRARPTMGPVERFEIPPPTPSVAYIDSISPDGTSLLLHSQGGDGPDRLWLRRMDSPEARPIPGTEGVNGISFWSSDNRFIAFGTGDGKFKKLDIEGGPAQVLNESERVVVGGFWTSDGRIVFGDPTRQPGLFEIPAGGGAAAPMTVIEHSRELSAYFPELLPDGRHFLYTLGTQPRGDVYIGSLDGKVEPQNAKPILSGVSSPGAVYAPSLEDPTAGYLLYIREAGSGTRAGVLMAQPFDPRKLQLVGESVPIADQVTAGNFSVSPNGTLVYRIGGDVATGGSRGNIHGQPTWFDREGKVLGAFSDVGVYRTLALSPDGKRVALERTDTQNPDNRNIWLYEFARGVTTRFTFDSAWDANPVWSPDGSRIVFGSTRAGSFDIYQKASNLAGEDELLFKSGETKAPSSWSADGRFLLYYNPIPPNRVSVLPLEGTETDRKPAQLTHSNFNEAAARFSPDGRWIAYSSDESGRSEIYVRPFDPSLATGSSPSGGTPITGKWMVSNSGGTTALWRRDGKELFYLSLDGTAMAVEVTTSGVFQAGIPKSLFKIPPGVLFWDVSADGKRFLMTAPARTTSSAPPPFTVVLSWQAGLKK